MISYEKQANNNTSKFVKEILEKMEFNEEEIKRVIRLIGAADNHELKLEDEEITFLYNLNKKENDNNNQET